MLARKALAGTAGAPKVYVEDVFSTYLYSGSYSTVTVTNNVDLSTEGGLVWIKDRGNANKNVLTDTVRGKNYFLVSSATSAQTNTSNSYGIGSFTTTGFTVIGDDSSSDFNASSQGPYVSWTFRKAEKFFDVVTYTGNGSGGRTINHNLGSAPGCIIIKCTSTTSNWMVWHRSISGQDNLRLNTTDSTSGVSTDPISVSGFPSSLSTTQFTVDVGSGSDHCNQNGDTYVAYLFAHDAGGFGDSGSDSIIKCGSFTTDANGEATVTLDWEPQWVLLKGASTSYTTNWNILDSMRGMPVSGNQNQLRPNTSDAEISGANASAFPNATGFKAYAVGGATLSGHTYIYIAIRRGPMKTPTTGTSVFETVTRNTTGANATVNAVITPVDLAISDDRNAIDGQGALWFDRLRGATKFLRNAGTGAEITASDTLTSFAVQNGYTLGADAGAYGINSSPAKAVVYWNFRRAPGFFDVVCYTGTGSNTTVTHNLGVAPELMIVKCRSSASTRWIVYSSPQGATKYLTLNETSAVQTNSVFWNDVEPTSTVFTVGTSGWVNGSTSTYVAYLFASLSGVSKIGTYTGNGSSVTVTTNFQPRFILVKRTDSTGNWIVSDSARGLVSGSDPYLLLNSTAAEDTDEDWVDVSSTGFTVNETSAANANVNTGTYIYLAIA